MNSKELQRLLIFYSVVRIFIISALVAIISIFPLYKELKKNEESNLHRTYAKTLYIAHDNFDELHALSRALAELCGTQSPNYFIQKPLVIPVK